jgi:hypothetical protein
VNRRVIICRDWRLKLFDSLPRKRRFFGQNRGNLRQCFIGDDFNIVLHAINSFCHFTDNVFGDILSLLPLFLEHLYRGIESLLIVCGIAQVKIRYAENQDNYCYCGHGSQCSFILVSSSNHCRSAAPSSPGRTDAEQRFGSCSICCDNARAALVSVVATA